MALNPEKIRQRFEKAVDLVQKTQAGNVAFENNCEQAFGEFRIATLHSKRVPHLLDDVTLKDDVIIGGRGDHQFWILFITCPSKCVLIRGITFIPTTTHV